MTDHDYVYIAREPDCGCVTAAIVDNRNHAEDVASEIGGWVLSGRHVSRVAREEGVALVASCPHWRFEDGQRVRAMGRLL